MKNLQDEMEDLTEQAQDIQEIMGRSYGMPEIDDSELEAELDALGDDFMMDEDSTYLDQASAAPNAPTSVPGMDSARNKVRNPHSEPYRELMLHVIYCSHRPIVKPQRTSHPLSGRVFENTPRRALWG